MEGKPQATYRQSIVVHPESAKRFEATGQLPAKPARRYEVRVAASGGERRGSVFADVEVPDFQRAPLALSGVLLSGARSNRPADARIAVVVPVVPLTVRTFTPRDAAVAFMRIYQRGRDRTTPGRIVATIVDDHDRQVFGRETPLEAIASNAAGRVDYELDIPLRELQPGNYLLTLDVSSGKTQASRKVRFSVR